MIRALTALLLLILISALGYYNHITHPRLPFQKKYGLDTAECGRALKLSYLTTVKNAGDIITAEDDTSLVKIDVRSAVFHRDVIPRPGERISVKGRYLRDNSIEAEFIHTHRHREYKIYFSVAVMFFVFYLFSRHYTFNFKKFIFVKR